MLAGALGLDFFSIRMGGEIIPIGKRGVYCPCFLPLYNYLLKIEIAWQIKITDYPAYLLWPKEKSIPAYQYFLTWNYTNIICVNLVCLHMVEIFSDESDLTFPDPAGFRFLSNPFRTSGSADPTLSARIKLKFQRKFYRLRIQIVPFWPGMLMFTHFAQTF